MKLKCYCRVNDKLKHKNVDGFSDDPARDLPDAQSMLQYEFTRKFKDKSKVTVSTVFAVVK